MSSVGTRKKHANKEPCIHHAYIGIHAYIRPELHYIALPSIHPSIHPSYPAIPYHTIPCLHTYTHPHTQVTTSIHPSSHPFIRPHVDTHIIPRYMHTYVQRTQRQCLTKTGRLTDRQTDRQTDRRTEACGGRSRGRRGTRRCCCRRLAWDFLRTVEPKANQRRQPESQTTRAEKSSLQTLRPGLEGPRATESALHVLTSAA